MTPEGKVKAEFLKLMRPLIDLGKAKVLRLQSGRARVNGGWMHGCEEGTPDLLVLLHGRAIFIELKAPGKEPTREQDARKGELVKMGHEVLWFDDARQAFEAVKERLR